MSNFISDVQFGGVRGNIGLLNYQYKDHNLNLSQKIETDVSFAKIDLCDKWAGLGRVASKINSGLNAN